MTAVPLRFVALLILALLAGCAPRIEAAGPAPGEPALNGDHILAADGFRLPLRVWPAASGDPRAVIAAPGRDRLMPR